ncbi:MAG: acyl-CoA thioesterase [Actinomycetes bacterium]
MDARSFLGLEKLDETHFRLEVTTDLITPGQFLFGGCGLGACIEALEMVTQRPAIWATAQYLSFAPTGSVVEIAVELPAVGKRITQGRAIASIDGREILATSAALGSGANDIDHVWVSMPEVPAPDDCPPRRPPAHVADSVFARIDTRVAKGRTFEEIDGVPGEPDSAIWARVPGHLSPSAATLAIYGDYLTGAVAHPVGKHTMGRSLDNTVRIVELVPTEWVLIDSRIHVATHGFAQGIAFLWAQDGTLLGTASQTLSIKLWDQIR